MDEIGVRALRAQLAGALRRAEAGERLVVTVGGRAVAQLAPLGDVGGGTTLADLADRGLLVRPRSAQRCDPPRVAVSTGTRLDRVLAEIR